MSTAPEIRTYQLRDYRALADFLMSEKAATVALPIDDAGIHAATLKYDHTADPLRFYFVTGRETEKCKLLTELGEVNGACVVGTHIGTPFTLQMRGQFTVLDPSQHKKAVASYYKKRGNRHDDIADPSNALIVFVPKWARFTDYNENYSRYFLKV